MQMDPNKQIKYSHYQITDNVQFGGLMDPEQCKALARKIMSLYDGNGDGNVDSFEVGYMLSDCYRAMNKGFNPTPTDIASYTRVIDKKGTGRVLTSDVEQLCLKYFGGLNSQPQQQSYQNASAQSQSYQNFSVQSPSQAPLSSLPPQQLSSYPPQRQEPPKLNKIAQERLEVARRIFRKVDADGSGFLTEEEVPILLRETYKQMGMNYEPTKEDVEIWMQMTDSDGDGKVTLEDYENLVLDSLKKQGITLD